MTTVDPEHAWNRSFAGWNLAFWIFMAFAAVRLVTADDLSSGSRVVGFVVIGVLSQAYALIPLEAKGVMTWPNLGYLMIAVVASGVACAADPTLGMLLFITYPQMWMFSGSIRNGVILTVLLTLSSAIGFFVADGWSLQHFWVIGPSVAISLLFSVVMGIWVTRIIDQSVDRALLIEQLEATRTELGEAHHAQGVMAERERMAREIHDTLAQGFTSIIMLTQAVRAEVEAGDPQPAADRLEAIELVARENLGEARALVAAFSPVALDGSTLTDAVRRLAQRFGTETGVAVDVDISGELAGLSRDRQVVLLRAAQEALANVRRHARARLVTVRLAEDGVSAMVQVDDDGVGFAVAGVDGAALGADSATGGFGLAGMRGRVLDAGGEVDVVSTPGAGTRVTVRVPLVAAS
jgi:signal transduction histidine kinase